MRHIFSTLLLALALPLAANEISMKRISAPNLLKNGDFSQKNDNGMPENWIFDNCSKADFTFRSDIGGIVIESPEHKFGYFLQQVAVKEGVRYCIKGKVRVWRTQANIWLSCPEYDDGGSPLGHYPPSQTTFFILAYPYQGESLKNVLGKFIDPGVIAGVNDKNWTTYMREFTPPVNKGIKNYNVRCGCYGGYKGWVNYTDIYFGLAAFELQITVNTRDWSKITVTGNDGKEYFTQSNNTKGGNTFSVQLPSQSIRYILTLTDINGKTKNWEVPHE